MQARRQITEDMSNSWNSTCPGPMNAAGEVVSLERAAGNHPAAPAELWFQKVNNKYMCCGDGIHRRDRRRAQD